MARTRIKICGMTRPEDAAAAVACGADAIGLIFARSPRQVTLAQAAAVVEAVPPPVGRIGVFVDAGLEEIEAAVESLALTAVQLHGSEPPAMCAALSVPVIKAVRVGTDFSLSDLEPYRGHAAALLLDTYVADKAGGTATPFSWQDVGKPPVWAPPVFVAGGLHPDNVGEAIRAMRPYAVDVSSGVESSPGIKDHDAITRFCAAVAAADREV